MQASKQQIILLSDNSELGNCLAYQLSEYQLATLSSASDCTMPYVALFIDQQYAERVGEEICMRSIKQAHRDLVPIFYTWATETDDFRAEAMSLGCSDFFAPPYLPSVLNAKLKTHLNLSSLQKQMSEEHEASAPADDQHEMLLVQDAAILCLATVARVRDHSTGNHILRTQHYVKALAEHLKNHPDFSEDLDPDTIELFYKTASLHDIGKVGIPDQILQKPGKLTADEYEMMKNHTVLGYQAIHAAEQLLEHATTGKAAKFLKIAQQVTLSHHERWDGTGYPQNLKGDDIPVVARLMAVADVYDAMISRRPYKGARDHQTAAKAIFDGSGTHFDPRVVTAFEDLEDTFANISLRLEDYFPSSADLTLHSMNELLE